jgi:CRISPR/Cas system CSM-associated protein Csm3 (group 7 of RAMP superfamily)
LDRIDPEDLAACLTALAAFDGGMASGVGAGRSRLQGRLAWEPARVRALWRDNFRAWLAGDGALDCCYVDLPTAAIPTDCTEPAPLPLAFRICPRAPLLVSERPTKTAEGEPQRVFQRIGQQVRIPAASLKGMLRAQCRRILLTMFEARRADHGQTEGQVADAMLAPLFGNTQAMALLHVGDAMGDYTQADVHPQFFNAIDRFTGGAADQRLYNVLAVLPRHLDWHLALQPKLLGLDWALGLLLYALRDAMDGDLQIGWGAARGYGAFRLAWLPEADDEPQGDWQVLRDRLKAGGLPVTQKQVTDWLDALDHEIRNRHSQDAQGRTSEAGS